MQRGPLEPHLNHSAQPPGLYHPKHVLQPLSSPSVPYLQAIDVRIDRAANGPKIEGEDESYSLNITAPRATIHAATE